MADEARFDQSNFTAGEIDPRTAARSDWEQYYKALKQARNGLVIPQGGFQNRWGTTYVDTATVFTGNPINCELAVLVYDNTATYLLVWETASLKIYLENILVATVVTPYVQEDIKSLRFSQVIDRIVVTSGSLVTPPQQLSRSGDNPGGPGTAITAFAGPPANTLTSNTGYAAGLILPVTFNTGGALPTTVPQILAGQTYFIRTGAANTFQVFSTSADAKAAINAYTINNAGAASNVQVQNTWTFAAIAFIFVPAYDFNADYFGATVTFTPSATSGTNISITAANATPFTPAHVGGLFEGNGGIVRITAYNSPTVVHGYTIQDFVNTNAIPGGLSFVGEPAWSATRGWPVVSTYFQQRLWFGGSPLIPNGIWGSVINLVYSFDDSETLADNAISWYPANGSANVIVALTSARSLIVHTNTGNYSTPLGTEIPLTPTNFVLTEHNKFGVTAIQPVYIDNQIIFVDGSGNNVINMIWEITQQSLVTNNISVPSSGLIIQPVDMAAFAQPNFTDGFYVLFVNNDGTMAVLQTLHEQTILAWTLQNEITYGAGGDQANSIQTPADYIRVVTGLNRAWVTVYRQIPTPQAGVPITNFNTVPNTLFALNAFNATEVVRGALVPAIPTMITFTTAGVLPTTVPQITTTTYFFAIPLTTSVFAVYPTSTDAINNTNLITITNAGVNSDVVVWRLTPRLDIEELDFTVFTDSSTTQTYSPATQTITGLNHLNGQLVQVKADGYVLSPEMVFNNQITVEIPVSEITVGLQYTTTLGFLPLTIPGYQGILYKPKHIRKVYINYYNTIGATFQGFDIPVITMQNIVIGQVPIPQTGVFEYTAMEGWNGFEFTLQVTQPFPLPITILAISYVVDI